MTHLCAFRDTDHSRALHRAREIRAVGGVPLIGDERWPASQWEQLSVPDEVPEGTGWASFTSGSTAPPRIILRTPESWDVSFPTMDATLGVTAKDTILVPVHPVSSMATFTLAWAMHTGFKLRTTSTARLQPADLDVDVIHCTPWQAREILNMPTHRVRTLLVGGDALPADLPVKAAQRGIQVVPYVGAAELSIIAWNTGSGMRAFPGVELRVEQQLWVRSAQHCTGVIGGEFIRDGEWATVGDTAEIHDGVVDFRGRGAAAIMTAGATVIPAEIEHILNADERITASLVLGVPDKALGQRVAAFIELSSGLSESEFHRLTTHYREVLSPAQRPRIWRAVKLPRTSIGKIKKVDLATAIALDATHRAGAIRGMA